MSADQKTCPYCAELIQSAAIKCKHCGSDLSGKMAIAGRPTTVELTSKSIKGRQLIAWLLVIVSIFGVSIEATNHDATAVGWWIAAFCFGFLWLVGLRFSRWWHNG